MTPLRIEKAFTHVLNALAELEALSSIDAVPGTAAWLARLETRLERYLTLTARMTSQQPQVSADLIRALFGRVKNALAEGGSARVFSAASDLRDEVAAHYRELHDGGRHGAAP